MHMEKKVRKKGSGFQGFQALLACIPFLGAGAGEEDLSTEEESADNILAILEVAGKDLREDWDQKHNKRNHGTQHVKPVMLNAAMEAVEELRLRCDAVQEAINREVNTRRTTKHRTQRFSYAPGRVSSREDEGGVEMRAASPTSPRERHSSKDDHQHHHHHLHLHSPFSTPHLHHHRQSRRTPMMHSHDETAARVNQISQDDFKTAMRHSLGLSRLNFEPVGVSELRPETSHNRPSLSSMSSFDFDGRTFSG